ncbi:MAG: 30S ribosomal protein S12 methylthiotransferase RimO [Candidatus Auribacterota bacterium]
MITVAFSTLGCPKNLVDTENMIDRLRAEGFSITEHTEHADVLVLNTCGFINKAQEESVQVIMDYSAFTRRNKMVFAVVGCLVERFREPLSEQLSDVDIWLGVSDSHQLGEKIKSLFPDRVLKPAAHPAVMGETKLTPPHYAYIKIADGCNHKCSFCVIPSIRGSYRSIPPADVISDATQAAKNGVKEICLVAQDISSYGKDLSPSVSLTSLLKELEKIDGIEWIRLLYLYPVNVTDELIELIAVSPKICKYIDIPLQHLSTSVLRNMHRPENAQSIDTLLKKIRTAIPDVFIRTSFIVGFPGESPEDFTCLKSGLQKYKFERLGVFTFSPEDGTHAKTLPDHIPPKTAEKRYAELMREQNRIIKTLNASLVGKKLRVIVDGFAEDDSIVCRTQWDAPEIDGALLISSYNTSTPLRPGDFLHVRVTSAKEYDLEGIIVDESAK